MYLKARTSTLMSMKKKRLEMRKQQGVTLLELMVGIAIGLMVVAVAMGALMVSRNVSGTVSDASGIQQQAAHALRTIGQQLRQAGSLYLNLDPNNTLVSDNTLAASTPVVFETTASSDASGSGNNFDPATNTLSGSSSNSTGTLTVGYRRYKESTFDPKDHTRVIAQFLARNCLGGPKDDSADQRVESTFTFTRSDSTLRCSGNGATAQPILQNVADFQVRYLQQDNTSAGDTKIQYVTASDVASNNSWSRVQAVEICMVLYGDEVIDIPAGSTYTGCDSDGTAVDFPTTGAAARRMHLTFRNVFQLRSQGLIGTVL